MSRDAMWDKWSGCALVNTGSLFAVLVVKINVEMKKKTSQHLDTAYLSRIPS